MRVPEGTGAARAVKGFVHSVCVLSECVCARHCACMSVCLCEAVVGAEGGREREGEGERRGNTAEHVFLRVCTLVFLPPLRPQEAVGAHQPGLV